MNDFLVDCGATTHIVNSDENFIYEDTSFNPADHFVELADGTRSNNVAKKRGTVSVLLQSFNGSIVKATLGNALYIPTYHQCIFSVQAATRKRAKVKFEGDSAVLIANDGNTFPIQQRGRLYYLCKTSITERRNVSLEMWHRLLGHCNVEDVKKLEQVVQGMKITESKDFDCETCILSKQTNTRNKEPDIRATKPFQLIHTDLAGPIDPTAKDGFRDAIIFTDDYSGCLFTYFIKEKSDAVKATEKFLADIAPYGNVKMLNFHYDVFPTGEVKRLRSDNGGEYLPAEFKSLLVKHGIKHELSSPYSPHQNGTAERNWRTLFDMARALLIESKMPKFLWTYAIMAAIYIRNRCYVQRIKNTPYGSITGLKPNVAKLHVFGTICYPYQQNAKKLEPRSKRGYFVGYDRDSPSYLVYYPETKAVMKHRLVKITEKFQRTLPIADLEPIPDVPSLPKPSILLDEATLTDATVESQTTRYPKRNRQVPNYLNDYDLTSVDETSDSVNHIDFCYMLDVSQSYEDATNCEDSSKLKIAMDAEIQSLVSSNTFNEPELPLGKRLVGGRWVYALKGDPEEPVYKARYVEKATVK